MGNYRTQQEKDETAFLAYERKKKAESTRQRMQSSQSAEIGTIPPIVDPRRRDDCQFDLKLFCETYLPDQFPLEWSAAHLVAIQKLESAILRGGLFAYAMRRGGGKTTLARAAIVWATLYGHRKYIVLLAATDSASRKSLRSIKTLLQCTELLMEDFPEICGPIRHLGGVAQRAQKQTYQGEPTNINWKQDSITYADIPGAEGAQCILETIGITGAVRGRNITRPDGTTVRPDFVLLDDVQKKSDARSGNRIQFICEIIDADVLGLAGPGESIAAAMTCTIIEPDDVADRYLDQVRNPMWRGEISGILESLPTNENLWLEYAQILAASMAEGSEGKPATEFYARNRAAMDEGAVATWPVCYEAWEISAIQNAMNLKIRNENAFWSEYMNQPRRRGLASAAATRVQIFATIGSMARRLLPQTTKWVTGFIDVHLSALYYAMVAWDGRSCGSVLDYGTWPEQTSRYYQLSSIKRTIGHAYAGLAEDAKILAAINDLVKALNRDYQDGTGLAMKPALILVDAGWGDHADTVFASCKGNSILLPSKGYGIGPAHQEITEWRANPGDVFAEHLQVSMLSGKRRQKGVNFDSNYWKSRVHRAFQSPMGSAGSLSLFTGNASEHELLADHVVSEFPTETFGRGRRVDVWRPNPQKMDNHWLDCLVGCCVADAIMLGAPQKPKSPNATQRRRWSDAG